MCLVVVRSVKAGLSQREASKQRSRSLAEPKENWLLCKFREVERASAIAADAMMELW